MKPTIIIMISMLGLMMPVFWITGTLTSIVYFIRHRMDTTSKEWIFALNP